MCYRPSWVAGPNDQFNAGKCPSCGMPVAAAIGITSGNCPHCGKLVTLETAHPLSKSDFPSKPKGIL